jgi:uncharacterized low-complexity protein
MHAHHKTLTLVLGSAFAVTFAAAPVAAATGNPFALTPLSSGYMVADHHEAGEKMKDGKCGSEAKGKEGNCSAETKDKEGSCSAEMKGKGEGGADKMKEGSCASDKS